MKNPKRHNYNFRSNLFSLAAILGMFAAAGTVTTDIKKADAGTVTADSKAWTNDGLTGEVGIDYRSFDVKRSTIIRTPVSVSHGVVVPASIRIVPVTSRVNNLNDSGKISGRVSSDILLSVGYAGKLYGSSSVKNGNLVGTIGSTAFNNGERPQMFGSIAYSPIKNTAVVVDFRRGQTSYGLQQQVGDAYIYGAYSPSTNGYAAGIGLEVGGNAPVAKAPSCPATYDLRDGGCIKKIAAPVRQVDTVVPLPPAPPKGEFGIRGRG